MKAVHLLCLLILVAGLLVNKNSKPLSKTTLSRPVLIHTVSSTHPNYHQGAEPFDFHWWSLGAVTVLPVLTYIAASIAAFVFSEQKGRNTAPCIVVLVGLWIYF